MRTSHLWLCIAVSVLFFACDRNVTHVEEVVGAEGCTDCHDDTNLITGKHTQWAESRHGNGEAFENGTRNSCAGCHSGNGFTLMIDAGQSPNQVTQGDPNPTRQDCRTCHMIHETHTAQDWALRTIEPVSFYAIPGSTFDGGLGNLCVNCHQPRRNAPVANNGVITGISDHWGPHHGPQSSMMLGVGGAGTTGTPGGHYGAIENSCVDCHMSDDRNHTMAPDPATCEPCHPGAEDFDINGTRTEIIALSDQLGQLLFDAGLISENSIDGHPIVTEAPEDQGIALWNWLYVHHEDRSSGAHNYDYAKAMLEEGITRMGGALPVTASRRD